MDSAVRQGVRAVGECQRLMLPGSQLHLSPGWRRDGEGLETIDYVVLPQFLEACGKRRAIMTSVVGRVAARHLSTPGIPRLSQQVTALEALPHGRGLHDGSDPNSRWNPFPSWHQPRDCFLCWSLKRRVCGVSVSGGKGGPRLTVRSDSKHQQ